MPGGHTPFGTRATPVFGPRPHSAAQFPSGRFLTNAGGSAFFPHGPKNMMAVLWVRIDQKNGPVMKIVNVGHSTDATTDILGIDYSQATDQFRAFGSNGSPGGYTISSPVPAVNPVIGTWYLITVEWGGTINITVTDPSGVDKGGSTGMVGSYNNLALKPVSLGADPGGLFPFAGAIDSFQVWNDVNSADFPSYFTGPPPGAWNSGRALDFSELPSTVPPSSKLQCYLNFGEPTGSARYADAGPAGLVWTPAGSGTIQRIPGAGY